MDKKYPWNARQAKAIWRSVEHHLENLQDPLEAWYEASKCACCQLRVTDPRSPAFRKRAYDVDCEGCPIYLATGKRWCGGVAYREAYDAWRALLEEMFGAHANRYAPDERAFREAVFREQAFHEAQTRLYQDLVEIALGEREPAQDPDHG